jgi:hypothetical protein
MEHSGDIQRIFIVNIQGTFRVVPGTFTEHLFPSCVLTAQVSLNTDILVK